MSSEIPRFTDKMKEEFPGELDNDSESLVAGVYHLTSFEVVDSEKYKKMGLLETKQGKFRTFSASVIGSLLGKPGEVLKKMLETHSAVEIEIVPKQANTGKTGIALKAF